MGARKVLRRFWVAAKLRRENRKFTDVSSLEEKFTKVYRTDHWGKSDAPDRPFYSGPGSDPSRQQEYVRVLSDLIIDKGVRSIADVGCGDFAIGRAILDRLEAQGHSVQYTGYDLVADLIGHNAEHHASPSRRFVKLDIVDASLPKTELTMVREVFQHLSNADVAKALENIAGNTRWLVVTEAHYEGADFIPNLDLPSKGTRTRSILRSGIDLREPPFNLQAESLLEARGKDSILMTLLIESGKDPTDIARNEVRSP